MYAGVAVLEQVGADDTKIIVGDMCKGRATFDVSQRINARYVGLQALVDPDIATFIGLHHGCCKIESIRVGYPASCNEQMRSCQSTFSGRRTHYQLDMAICSLGSASGICLKQDFYAVLAQYFSDFVGHIFVFAYHQVCPSLDYRDLAAEKAEHLPEFQTDIATAYDQQVFRHDVELHD